MHATPRRLAPSLASVLALAAASVPAADNPTTELEAPAVNVVGTTPLPGVGTPLEQVPANVQLVPESALRGQTSPGVVETLESHGTGFAVNDPQGNPYQPDVEFRGFAASPLLGTPQGISVYMDGVRVNESFGDVVNWDLVPRIAISTMQVIPGSNPVFGLNTLGGAVALYTKSGFKFPGGELRGYGGSFGRLGAEMEAGGFRDDKDYYAAANLFDEHGWREHSRSAIRQFFGKIGMEDAKSDVDFSVTAADSTLNGTQALPLSMLGNPRQPYTWPDQTHNRLAFANLRSSTVIDAERVVAANAYLRNLSTRALNSNVNDACASGPCAFNASNVATTIDETRAGGAVQLTLLAAVGGHRNQLATGLSFDYSSTDFTGASQEATFTTDRQAVGTSAFATDTSVASKQRYARVYVLDTLSLTEALALTASASVNTTTVEIRDRSGVQPALNGSHSFTRALPALGLTYSPAAGETWYASASTGMRAPTAMELTCADPSAPCQLPNVFLADPALKPVLAQTLEAGFRLPLGAAANLAAAVYRTALQDDIQFISTSGATINAGYFQNVGRTQRQGVELAAQATLARWTLAASFSYVDATFRTPFTAFSPNNSSADAAGDIRVASGDRIPGIPRGTFKMRFQYAVNGRATVGATLLAFSSRYARGDENNADAHGPVPGYALLNLDAQWQLGRGWQLFANINNLFNRRYATFGVLGANFFTGPGNAFDAANVRAEQFRTPGAPLGVWVGIGYRFADGGQGGKHAPD
jgi:outer membrane receptor protein involved in Fe transport